MPFPHKLQKINIPFGQGGNPTDKASFQLGQWVVRNGDKGQIHHIHGNHQTAPVFGGRRLAGKGGGTCCFCQCICRLCCFTASASSSIRMWVQYGVRSSSCEGQHVAERLACGSWDGSACHQPQLKEGKVLESVCLYCSSDSWSFGSRKQSKKDQQHAELDQIWGAREPQSALECLAKQALPPPQGVAPVWPWAQNQAKNSPSQAFQHLGRRIPWP